eukprot:7384251-Prymnesium_polylepis.3
MISESGRARSNLSKSCAERKLRWSPGIRRNARSGRIARMELTTWPTAGCSPRRDDHDEIELAPRVAQVRGTGRQESVRSHLDAAAMEEQPDKQCEDR